MLVNLLLLLSLVLGSAGTPLSVKMSIKDDQSALHTELLNSLFSTISYDSYEEASVIVSSMTMGYNSQSTTLTQTIASHPSQNITSVLAATAEDPPDYQKLVEYAHIASASYCIKKGLSRGKMKDNCRLEVCNSPQFDDIDILHVFDLNKWGGVGSGYYALDNKKKQILLVYRGSALRRDWIGNMDFLPVEYVPLVAKKIGSECVGCTVHRGFYVILQNVRNIIKEVLLLSKKYPDYKLVLVGHSLGAALAVLTGIEFQLLGYEPLIVSYGSPRVGNARFNEFCEELLQLDRLTETISNKKDFDHGLVKVMHKGDVIPYLPPSPIFLSAGYNYYIDKGTLPHESKDLDRFNGNNEEVEAEQAFYTNNEKVEVELAFYTNPSKYWIESLGKYQHSHYFIKISGC